MPLPSQTYVPCRSEATCVNLKHQEIDFRRVGVYHRYMKGPRERERDTSRAAKSELLSLLGGKCCRCGFADARALQFDHINGGGCAEIRKSGNRRHYYRKLLREMAQGVYRVQVLCANCNWIKRHENTEHPTPCGGEQ